MSPDARRARTALAVAAGLAVGAEQAGALAEDQARPDAPPACAAADVERRLGGLLASKRFLDVHIAAQALATTCGGRPGPRPWLLADALALVELDEGDTGRSLLAELAADPQEPALAARAAMLSAWSHLRDDDRGAERAAAAGLTPEARVRLDLLAAIDDATTFRAAAAALPDLGARARLLDAHADYDRLAHRKRPWLAGALSALLPGAGQIYAGSWSAAGVSFVLNAALIGSAVELGRHRLWWSAGAATVGASFFYVGGVINAADLARRRNETGAALARTSVEHLLLPEYPHP